MFNLALFTPIVSNDFAQPVRMSGFSIFQPSLGATLQWLPALGTAELDEMVHAFLPGPSSIQDKRAHITMDFFEYSQRTGKNFKFYPAPESFSSTAAPSPASSAPLYDSGYASSFNASPVVSDMNAWTPSSTVFTPVSFSEETGTKGRSAPSRKSTASSSRQQADFAHHPGMRIMTKDGRDVTNSASRGCKTKEQRDHAHLMRIIKACDACKRKKIRCDPSHKKRTASQASSSSQPELKPAKKAKKTATPPPEAWPMSAFDFSIFTASEEAASSAPFESPESTDDLWNQYMLSEQEPTTLATNFNLDDYDFDFFSDQELFTPSLSNSSASPSQWFPPFTPTSSGPSPPVIAAEVISEAAAEDLTVPYLNPSGSSQGANYVDFNLYSPPSDFFLDEEPLPAKKATASSAGRLRSPQSNDVSNVPNDMDQQPMFHNTVAHSSDWYCSSPSSPQCDGHQSHSRRLDEDHHATSPVISSLFDNGSPAFCQVNDGHGIPGSAARGAPQSDPGLGQITRPSPTQRPGGAAESHGGSRPPSQPAGSLFPLNSAPAETGTLSSLVPQCDSLRRGFPDDGQGPEDATSTSLSGFDETDARPTARAHPSSRSRPLSLGQQLQTLSSHGTSMLRPLPARPSEAARPCEPAPLAAPARPNESAVPSLVNRPVVLSSLAGSPHRDFSYPSSTSAGSGLVAEHGSTVVPTTLAAVLLTTLPMRRLLVGGVCGGAWKDGQRQLSSLALFQFAVLGLVSSLLSIAVQSQSPGIEVDLRALLNFHIITALACTSMLGSYAWSPKTAPTATSVGTFGNVKTKIQAKAESMGDDLRCAVTRLQTLLPRPRTFNSIKF